MIKLNFRRFMFYTFIGSVFWIGSIVMAGYLLGTMLFLKPYLKYIIIAIILAVTTPVVVTIIRKLNNGEKQPENPN